MKTFQLKKDSWHHRLAATYGPMNTWTDSTNICSYAMSVFGGATWIVMLLAMRGLLIGIPVGDFIGWILAMSKIGVWIVPEEPAWIIYVALGSISVLILVGILIYSVYAIKTKYFPAKENDEPGFISQAYTSFKQKSCHKIELT